jgi:enterochelin esterase-like enzyme
MKASFILLNYALNLLSWIAFPFAILASPLHKPGWDQEQTDHDKGHLSSYQFTSKRLKNKREIWIYTPAGYNTKSSAYPLLIVFDGQAYTSELIPGPTILDNLIAEGQIPPLVSVFISSIDQPSRNLELPCYEPFVNSLTTELLPWVHAHYHVSKTPDQTIIAGSSYGGLAAAYAAWRNPHKFGKVLSQSGAYWWQPAGSKSGLWLIRQYETAPKLPIKFYLDVGNQETEESAERMSMVKVNRLFSDLLKRKGYDVSFEVFQGGHDYDCWRKTFATGLITLMRK